MTKRALMVIACALLLLLCALSTRGTLFWLLFYVLVIMLITSAVAAFWAWSTVRVDCGLDNEQVDRGEGIVMTISVQHKCLLPIGAIRLDMCEANVTGNYALYAVAKPFVANVLRYELNCPHVGAYPSGITGVCVRDVFGLFAPYRKVMTQEQELIVLPQVYLERSLSFSPGDSDNDSVTQRAFEDATMPTDLRAFQQGDELKKVHWKLSMRRKELLVRVYEQPQRPDALLLIDCAPPQTAPELRPFVRDAICEAAASVASIALQDGAPVRMPLLSDQPVDINATKQEDIGMIRMALARCAFDGTEQFERVLLLETRRMRRTGSTAIVTGHLSPALADMILRIRRMGPKVRVMVAANIEEENTALIVTRLMRNDVEVDAVPVMLPGA